MPQRMTWPRWFIDNLARKADMVSLREFEESVAAELKSRKAFAELVAAYDDDGEKGEIVG